MTAPQPSSEAVASLAPRGVLRAGINLSNFLLVTDHDADGQPVGVSPDIAGALGAALGVEVSLITYPSPAAVADAATEDEWDIGNIGAEPQRAEHIAFSPPYCQIEATLLVPGDSELRSFADVDRPGMRIAVKARAAYALWLERHLTAAELVQVDSHDAALAMFVDNSLDALASLRPRLIDDAPRVPGGRVLDDRFTVVQQAIGTPRSRPAAAADYLTEFVGYAIESGLVASLIDRHGVTGKLQPAPSPSG